MKTVEIKCTRCDGSGFVPQFGHILKGLCFRCNGAGTVRVRARKDGTPADCTHQLPMQYWKPEAERSRECIHCGLPLAQWPTVVPAHWYGDCYIVYLPGEYGAQGPIRVYGTDRRKTQSLVRAAVADAVANSKIKWMDRTR